MLRAACGREVGPKGYVVYGCSLSAVNGKPQRQPDGPRNDIFYYYGAIWTQETLSCRAFLMFMFLIVRLIYSERQHTNFRMGVIHKDSTEYLFINAQQERVILH